MEAPLIINVESPAPSRKHTKIALGAVLFVCLIGFVAFFSSKKTLLSTYSQSLVGKNEISSDVTVYMIRHAEKPNDDSDPDLSCQGWKRAQCLAGFFDNKDFDITYLYGMQQKSKSSSCRGINTLIPLSNEIDVDINTCFEKGSEEDLVKDISKLKKGNVLIAWEHANIEDIAKAFGVKNVPSFPSGNYDAIWVFKNGKLTTDSKEDKSCAFKSSVTCTGKDAIPSCGSYKSPIKC